MSETLDPTTSDEAQPRRLVRTRDGRWLGGVAAGLGRYFDVNPLVYRIAFAALAFVGGTGILLYVAAWLVIPAEDGEESVAVETLRRHRDRPWLLFGVGLLSFGALLALSEARFWPSPGNVWLAATLAGAAIVWWHVSTRGGAAPAERAPAASETETTQVAKPAPRPPRRPGLTAPVVGALLAAAGFFGLLAVLGVYAVDVPVALAGAVFAVGVAAAFGAATGRRVAGLILVGLTLLATFGIARATPVSLDAGIGDRVERPVGTGIDRTYELGIGDLTVDLGTAILPEGPTDVDARVGIGELLVIVPAEVALDVDARVGAGQVDVLGRHDDGTGAKIDLFVPGPTPDAPVLKLDADVAIGHLEVRRG